MRALSASDHPAWRTLLGLCAAATALSLWTGRYLPFTDLPQHVAMIGTFRHWADPAWSSPYTLALGQTQYLLYYLAGALLAFPLGTAERANLVLLSAVAVALPYALRSLLRALEQDERLALFGCTLFWSKALLIGFFNYVAALPVLLWGLALAVRQAEEPTRRRAFELAVLSVVLFYLHLSAFVFFALGVAITFFLLPEGDALAVRAAKLLPRVAWAAPVSLLVLLFLLKSPVVHPRSVGWEQPVQTQWETPIAALRNLPDALLDIWQGSADEWILLSLVAAGVLCAWPAERDPETKSSRRKRSLAATLVLVSAALYFFFPISIGWLWQLNERYAIVGALLLPALIRPARGLRGALPLALAALVSLFAASTTVVKIRAFNEEVGPFDEVLSHAEPGKRLLSLIYERYSGVANFAPFVHFGSYYRARHGGVAEFSFSELPQSPLRYRPGLTPPQRPPRWEWMPELYRNEVEGPFYDYLLERGNVDPFARHPAGPAWEVAARGGPWILWKRR